MFISLVDRIMSFIIKRRFTICVGLLLLCIEWKWLGSVRAVSSDRFLVEIASEKVVNCYGASSRQSDKEYLQPKTISNPSLDVFELIANPSSAVSIMKMIFRLLWIIHGVVQLYCVFRWGNKKDTTLVIWSSILENDYFIERNWYYHLKYIFVLLLLIHLIFL